jgi:hypothetical protein
MSLLKTVFVFSLTAIALTQIGYAVDYYEQGYTFSPIRTFESLQTPASFQQGNWRPLEKELSELDSLIGEDSSIFLSSLFEDNEEYGEYLERPTYIGNLEVLPRQEYPKPYPCTFRLLASLSFQTFVRIPGVKEGFIFAQHLIRMLQLGLGGIDRSLDRITQR